VTHLGDSAPASTSGRLNTDVHSSAAVSTPLQARLLVPRNVASQLTITGHPKARHHVYKHGGILVEGHNHKTNFVIYLLYPSSIHYTQIFSFKMRPSSIFFTLALAALPALAIPTPSPKGIIVRPVFKHPHHYDYDSGFYKRQDGGSAESGNAGDANGGNSINEGGRDGTVTDDGAGTGQSYSLHFPCTVLIFYDQHLAVQVVPRDLAVPGAATVPTAAQEVMHRLVMPGTQRVVTRRPRAATSRTPTVLHRAA
jgi:hypothetical protein